MAKIVNISQSTKYSTIIFCLPRTLGTVGTWDSVRSTMIVLSR